MAEGFRRADKRRAQLTQLIPRLLKLRIGQCRVDDPDRILLLLLATGARLGEIVGLRLEDVLEGAADGLTSVTITGHEKRRLKNKVSEGR